MSSLAQKTFEDYVREGPLAALDAIKQATGEDEVHAVGYCVGGTMLAVALAAMAAWHDERIMSATLFAAQVDFTYAGDLKVFVDEEQVEALEQRMAERGYLEGMSMATVFNLLRSNDLIWPYVINNYLKGKAPFPFDLLYWNSDATRLPAANHSFYMRNCYLDNKLAQGQDDDRQYADRSEVGQEYRSTIWRRAKTTSRRPKSVLLGCKFFGGPVRFVLAGSGHIAGVVNPPDKQQISVLDRTAAAQRQPRRLARQGEGASGLVVAGLARLAQSTRTRPKCPRAYPAAARSSRSRTRREAT